jgi:hypothetical protein
MKILSVSILSAALTSIGLAFAVLAFSSAPSHAKCSYWGSMSRFNDADCVSGGHPSSSKSKKEAPKKQLTQKGKSKKND